MFELLVSLILALLFAAAAVTTTIRVKLITWFPNQPTIRRRVVYYWRWRWRRCIDHYRWTVTAAVVRAATAAPAAVATVATTRESLRAASIEVLAAIAA
mgnify:CR=1 FL=1